MKVFFGNFLRCLVYGLIVAAITMIVVLVGVDLVVADILHIKIKSALPYYITSAILGLILGFFFILIFKEKWGFLEGATGDPRRASTVRFGLIVLLLIFTGIPLITDILLNDFFNRMVITNASDGDWSLLISVITSFTGSQLVFIISIWLGYEYNEICHHCKHIFCISKAWSGATEEDTTQYTTKTQREKLGTLEAGNFKTDVYADVNRGYSRNKHTITTKYNCRCTICQIKFENHKTDVKFGEWE